MPIESEIIVDKTHSLPKFWRESLSGELAPDETPLAWAECDLDEHLHYAHTLIVATNQRILARSGEEHAWRTWPLADCTAMTGKDHAGVGTLHLLGHDGLLGQWRFTIGVNKAVGRLIGCFDACHRGELSSSAAWGAAPCSRCGAVLGPDETECATCSPTLQHSASSLWRLWRFAKPRTVQIILGIALTVGGTTAGLVPPYLTKPIVDRILIPHQHGTPVDTTLAAWLMAGLTGAAVLSWLMGWGRAYVLAWVSERIGSELRTKSYEHLQTLSLEYFGGMRTGDLIARISTDTDRINTFLSVYLLNFATDVLAIIMTTVILVSIDPVLALFSLAPIPLLVWPLQRVRGSLRQGFERSARAWAEMTNVLADTIPGVRVVKAFAQERREITRFRKANDHVLEVTDRVNTIWAFFSTTVTLGTDIGLLVVWAFGIWSVAHDSVTVGTLTAFVAYIGRFYARLESMSRIASFTMQAAASAERLFDVLDRVPTVPEPANPAPIDRLQGAITLRCVGFRYGTRSVLSGVDMVIPPGKMVGLVGPSGAGKSTLVNLVCRFYDVTEGAILVDGVDIRSFPISLYRGNIGLVLQEPFLFYGTIAENIGYGRPDATRDQLIAAARAARAHEFILRLADGYDSLVGERGQFLSGGERQRISIARALLIDPRILILDEATSSVDTETEREIQEALNNLVRGRTTIAIAHRLSTLRRADWVVAVENGAIAETGSHDELLALDGVYARLYKAQSSGEQHETIPEHFVPRPEVAAPPPAFKLRRDSWGQLVADMGDGTHHVGVEPARAFPITDPTRSISICDSKGHELVFIDDLSSAPAPLRASIEQALAQREFVPVITRILSTSTVGEQAVWEVETDRGHSRLRLQNQDMVRYLSRTALRIIDSDSIRYAIPDTRDLDRSSRRILDRYLH